MFKRLLLSVTIIVFCQVNYLVAIRQKKPKGCVSFAALILMNNKSEILLLRRKGTSFGNGLYSLPGGKIESGETALEAAKREAKEEVGIEVDGLAFVHIVDRQGPETEFYVSIFKALRWQGDPCNCEPDKCDEMSWFALHQLPENIIPAHLQAIELSEKNIFYSVHGWE